MEFAVIGLGRFGSSAALALSAAGHKVLAIDVDPQKTKEIMDQVDYAVTLDGTDEKALDEISISHVDYVIVGMGKSSMSQSLLTCLSLQNLGVTNIIAKAVQPKHAEILERIGITEIVNPEEDMGKRVAKRLTSKDIFEYIRLSDKIRLDGFKVTSKNKDLVDRTIEQINLRKNLGINIIFIKRDEEIIIAEKDTLILANDVIVVVGEDEKITKFIEKKFK